jgi:flagellar M-ring protein FliF
MEFWQNLSKNKRIGFIAGLILIIGLTSAIGWWALRTEYGVLFADLSGGDASSMVAELERMKTPYRLGDGGHTILVPQDMVYKTRLKLMGKELPLHGAVGFEVFNNADFGMTEFVQKVNYQRAVSGELTRTIMAGEDIQSARVHLAVPEQGLFKKSQSKPKASVTLALKPGHTLAAEQILGIQRLVAAAVPELQMADVAVLDGRGVSLGKAANVDPSLEMAQTQLDSKRSLEDYLQKKITPMLDNLFGAGVALATVDVVLNLDQNKITTEDVLPAKGSNADGIPTGVIVRERQSNQGGMQMVAPAAAGAMASSASHDSGRGSSEADYQVGRRVEQLAVAPGGVRRMTVAVVIKKSLSEAQIAHVRETVSLALGINAQRGDAIVVQSMDQLLSGGVAASGPGLALTPTTRLENGAAAAPTQGNSTTTAAGSPAAGYPDNMHSMAGQPTAHSKPDWLVPLLVVLVLLLLAILIIWQRSRHARPAMEKAERERLLQEIRQWIIAGEAESGSGGRT